MNTPLCDAVQSIANKTRTRFFMPGHKANTAAMPRFGGVLPFDITEVPGADDLQNAAGPLAQSQANMARAYRSGATLYSASGSTSCILAMLTLFVGPGKPVVMARGCHVAAVRALALLDATPVWVLAPKGPPTPAAFEAALKQSGAGAVYLTSPDYYGRVADIPALAGVCRRYGAALLVDNAHGAHLRFLQPNRHPIALGADACADSAHKTLPCLTPAALLHLREAGRQAEARQALNLYSSTSPSYLVLQSLDWAAGLLAAQPPDFAGAAVRLAAVAANAGGLAQAVDDPLKLCLRPAQLGLAPKNLLQALQQAGIEPEFFDGERIVLMASPWNTPQDFEKLQQLLAAFAGEQKAQETTAASQQPIGGPARAGGAASEQVLPQTVQESGQALPLPKVLCSPRQALLGPKQNVPVQQAEGRVCASLAVPCPPGVPLVMPGEQLDHAAVAALAAGGILALDVVK